MATTTGTLVTYNTFHRDRQNGTMDMDTDAFRVQLHTSSYVPSVTADEVRADLSDELSTANGYTVLGEPLGSVTLTEPTPGTWRFDSADPVWTAASGSIVARFYVVFDDTPGSPLDPLCFHGLLDNTPADVTTTDTNTLTIQVNASGYYELSG